MPDTGFDNLLIVAAVALAAPLLAALALLGGNSAVQVGGGLRARHIETLCERRPAVGRTPVRRAARFWSAGVRLTHGGGSASSGRGPQ